MPPAHIPAQGVCKALCDRLLADINVVVEQSSRSAKLYKIANETKISHGFAGAVFYEYGPVKHSTDNLAWIAHKAVENVEINTAALAVNAMARIVSHYLTSLQQNEVIRSSIPSLDAKIVQGGLRPFYEHLKDVSNHAVTRNNETTCIQVILALETIASHPAMSDEKVFGKFDATNAVIPIGYLKACSANAQRNNMYDAVLEASHALKRFARNWKDHQISMDIYSILLENWYEMALGFSLVGHRTLVNQVIADMMELAQFLITQEYFLAKEVFGFILNKLESLVALDLKNHGNLSLLPPLVPYDLLNPLSISNLIRQTVFARTVNGENEKEEGLTPPHSQLTRFLKTISEHFRNLADSTNIAASSGFFQFAQVVDDLGEIVLETIGKEPSSERDKKLLLDQTSWLLSFYWAAFASSAKMGGTKRINAERACDSLAYFGMAFHKAGFKDFAISAAQKIAFVTSSYCKATQSPASLDVADLLIHGYQLQQAIRLLGDESGSAEVQRICAPPGSLDTSARDRVIDGLSLRVQQLEEELRSDDHWASRFKSRRLLKDLLFKAESNPGNKCSHER